MYYLGQFVSYLCLCAVPATHSVNIQEVIII